MSNKTFTDNDILTEAVTVSNSETFVYLGLVNSSGADVSSNLGSGTILIAKLAADGSGNYVPLKTITSLNSTADKASRFVLPANQTVAVILTNAISPNLYVEIQVGPRRNP